MIKMVIQNSYILISFLMYSCASLENDGKKTVIDTAIQSNSIISNVGQKNDTLVGQWRQDSLGCNGQRSYEKAKALVVKYELLNKSVSEIITLIGEPNKRIEYKNGGIMLRYYYNSCCRDGKFYFECDYSWWDFIFDDSTAFSNKIGGGKT